MAAAPAPKELQLDTKYDDYDYPTSAPTPQNGHPGYTTPEQDAQVFQLRSLLEAEGYTQNLDTLTLVRFLRDTGLLLGSTKLTVDSCGFSARASSMSSSPRRCTCGPKIGSLGTRIDRIQVRR